MPAVPKRDVFQAIADPTRRRLLRLVADDESAVTTLSGHFPISRTAVAKHLRILEEAGLVGHHKQGRARLYHLHPEPLIEVKKWLSFYEDFWDKKIDKLKDIID